MEILPETAQGPYGPTTLALRAPPKVLRPQASETCGGIRLQEFVLYIAHTISRQGRELWVKIFAPRVFRLRIREPVGQGGGLRVVAWVHIHDCGSVEVSGQARVEIAREIHVLGNSDLLHSFFL